MLVLETTAKRHESRHANDDALAFKVVALRNRMIADWAAHRAGMSESEGKDLRHAIVALGVSADGGEAIVDRLLAEFRYRDLDVSLDELGGQMRRLLAVAEERVRGIEAIDARAA